MGTPYIINCPTCNAPMELRHIPGKATVEAVAVKRSAPPDPGGPPPVDDNVSAIHRLIDEANDGGQ